MLCELEQIGEFLLLLISMYKIAGAGIQLKKVYSPCFFKIKYLNFFWFIYSNFFLKISSKIQLNPFDEIKFLSLNSSDNIVMEGENKNAMRKKNFTTCCFTAYNNDVKPLRERLKNWEKYVLIFHLSKNIQF